MKRANEFIQLSHDEYHHALDALKKHLSQLPSGPIKDTLELASSLSPVWDEMADGQGGMKSDKLFGRMEDVYWSRPELTFSIERHGGLHLGSSRAELQHWRIDLNEQRVELVGTTHRQIKPIAPRFYAARKAEEIVLAVREARQDIEFLKWTDNETVRVLITKILPSGFHFKQTISGRRKRLRIELVKQMKSAGWVLAEKRDTFVLEAQRLP